VLGSTCFNKSISVAFALVPTFWCASRPVIQAFVFFLLCVAPHTVLGFLTGPCPVGFAGRNNYSGATATLTAASATAVFAAHCGNCFLLRPPSACRRGDTAAPAASATGATVTAEKPPWPSSQWPWRPLASRRGDQLGGRSRFHSLPALAPRPPPASRCDTIRAEATVAQCCRHWRHGRRGDVLTVASASTGVPRKVPLRPLQRLPPPVSRYGHHLDGCCCCLPLQRAQRTARRTQSPPSSRPPRRRTARHSGVQHGGCSRCPPLPALARWPPPASRRDIIMADTSVAHRCRHCRHACRGDILTMAVASTGVPSKVASRRLPWLSPPASRRGREHGGGRRCPPLPPLAPRPSPASRREVIIADVTVAHRCPRWRHCRRGDVTAAAVVAAASEPPRPPERLRTLSRSATVNRQCAISRASSLDVCLFLSYFSCICINTISESMFPQAYEFQTRLADACRSVIYDVSRHVHLPCGATRNMNKDVSTRKLAPRLLHIRILCSCCAP